MKRVVLACLLLLCAGNVHALDLITPESEYALATEFLKAQRFTPEDSNFIRFFTTYSIPKEVQFKNEKTEMRKLAEQVLPFAINSCASVKSEGLMAKPKLVPRSDTLWWLDIRDVGWNRADIDEVFKIQPYFLSPFVAGDNNVIMFRADWFIVNSLDATNQDDRGLKTLVYYILIYGKGKEPKNADEFRKAWVVDLETIRVHKLETGSTVDAGDSGVSRHTRQLRRARTLFGYYWETRDVKSHDLDPLKLESRDYIEDIFAKQVDASEFIVSHKNGLQAYFLTAGNAAKFARVESGDPGVVWHQQDKRDVRVRTAKACIDCHGIGIIPHTNNIAELFQLGGDLKIFDKALAREVKAFNLKYKGEEVDEDNRIYEKAVRDCNGLEPIANARAFGVVYDWYWNTKVSLDQAALECGMSTDDYKKAIEGTTGGRLTFLFHGKGMPREVWDSINVGGYIQSMALIKKIETKVEEKQNDSWPGETVTESTKKTVVIRVNRAGVRVSEDKVAVYIPSGTRVDVLGETENYYYVSYQDEKGYIKKTSVK